MIRKPSPAPPPKISIFSPLAKSWSYVGGFLGRRYVRYDRNAEPPRYTKAVPDHRDYQREYWLRREEQEDGERQGYEAAETEPAWVAGFLRGVERWTRERDAELTPEAEQWLEDKEREHLGDEMEKPPGLLARWWRGRRRTP